MSGLIDTHTHLDSFWRKGTLDAAIASAKEANVERLVTVGTDTDDWSTYADLADAHPDMISYTVGLHPCSVERDWEERVERLPLFFERRKNGLAGLGEIGLDRFHLPKDEAEAKSIFALQRAAFEWQLELAKSLSCPIVIHSRGAFEECVATIDASGVDWGKVVFHCFSEGPSEMKQLVDRGGFGSFTGVITFKNAQSVREAATLQGMDRLMVETDAPYLAPMPHRGKPNEPAYVAFTAEYCAALFGIGIEEFSSRSTATAKAFYGLP